MGESGPHLRRCPHARRRPDRPTDSLPILSTKLIPAAIVATSAIALFGFENRTIGYPWLLAA